MRFNSKVFWRVIGIFTLLDLALLLAGCSTAWTTEATNIIQLLIPAVQAALAILAAFGVGIPTTVMTAVNSWAQQAEQALLQVKGLIEQYNTAEASAQPGILNEIQTVLGVVSSNLATILPTLHVTDPATEAKIAAVFQAVAGEIAALLALVPALQGKVTSHDELKQLMAAVKSPKEFKSEFNAAAGQFGKQYEI